MTALSTDRPAIPVVRLEDLVENGIPALEEAGCLVITGVTDASERQRVRAELAPHMDRTPVQQGNEPEAFFPGHTRRIASLVARSETARDWIMHPLAKALCDHFLLPHCDDRYQLHIGGALEVGPGASRQRPGRCCTARKTCTRTFPGRVPNWCCPRCGR